LRVHVFGDPLAPLPDPIELPALDGQDWGETRILSSESGFVLIGDNRFGAGLFRAAVDLNGAIAESTTAIEGASEGYSAVHSTSRPGGGFALAAAVGSEDRRTIVMALDKAGHVRSSIEERWVALPRAALGLDDGRVAVLFTNETNEDETELTIEFYGCALEHER